ncbi:MAG TPA: TonB-dependent receptor [Saprospiraceae bacterium]|nr:TonB-dependent receptor [Saprospiraceae bacterium]HMX85794.1 TonB-dependent receptor [Saprospiraceae bacterium]
MQIFLKRFLFIVMVLNCVAAFAQYKTVVTGRVADLETNQGIEFVNIRIDGTTRGTESDEDGNFEIVVNTNEKANLIFTRIGYKQYTHSIPSFSQGQLKLDIKMVPADSKMEVVITEEKIISGGMVRQNVEELKLLPSASGNLESALPSIALGTSSGTGGELSAQYNVRGGNYDENLVYINDFEIFRPQLIRTSQQEGLTFPNIDLIRDLSFSSGGFQAKYGDKLSSVLDINYKRPEKIKASVSGSFLGGSAHLEGSRPIHRDTYRKFRYLVGARYKTSKYLLNSLEVEGEYVPTYTDIQTFLTYDITRSLQLGIIGNYNKSNYYFKPESSSSGAGLVNFALRLSTAYEGQEADDFAQMMGGLSLTFVPDTKKNPYFIKLLAAAHRGYEDETYDILGYYSLGQVETNLGSDKAGQVVAVLGEGTQHNYARNHLISTVKNLELRGGHDFQGKNEDGKSANNFLEWSLKAQSEEISDKLNEWERLDSAGYSLNYSLENLYLKSVLKTKNQINSIKYSAFIQNTYTIKTDDKAEWKLNLGVRAMYRDLNSELLVGPRAQVQFRPLSWHNDWAFRLSGGYYYQPAFYREMRRPNGTVNTGLLSQKSAQIVGGISRQINWTRISDKPFTLIAEMYYKKLWDVVSYEVDNVRIRYSGENNATGYVTGFDLRLNGEFVPNAESWINLSFLRARENLDGVQHKIREVGQAEGKDVADVPRPTDQLFNVNIFFQDYLPRNENFKVHINLAVGSGLPFGIKDNNQVYRNTYRYSAYHRADIGFSLLLWDKKWKDRKPHHFLRFSENTWVSLEIFNLLNVQNTASNNWIKTVFNTQYAIPNRLTSRRINLRLRMDF